MVKKGSPKKSKSSSPKKKSPKGDVKSSDNADVACQTEFTYYCMQCGKEFNSGAAIQAHTILFDHKQAESPYIQKCRACHDLVEIKHVDTHLCTKNKEGFLESILCGSAVKYGPPNICLLCRGSNLKSRSNLITHLFTRHRTDRIPGTCGDCSFQFDESINKEQSQSETNLPNYNLQMDHHSEQQHNTSNALIIKRNTQMESYLRFPYVCPYCHFELEDNAQFQTHILYVHGTNERYENFLNVCKGCNYPTESQLFLSRHVLSVHGKEMTNIAKKHMRENLVQNYVPLAQTCTLCWMNFKYDFYLQAHILVTHISKWPFECGLCKRDFSHCGKMTEIWQLMQKHELNHYRAFHLVALERKLTFEPVPDEIPEVIDQPDSVDEKQNSKKKNKKPGKKDSPSLKKEKKSPKGSKGSPKKK